MPKPKIKSPASAIGVAWYRPEEWEALRNASVDSDKLEESYAEWLKGAEKFVDKLRRQGFQVTKVDVEIADLLLWCENQKIPLDSEARSKYAAFKLQQLSQQE